MRKILLILAAMLLAAPGCAKEKEGSAEEQPDEESQTDEASDDGSDETASEDGDGDEGDPEKPDMLNEMKHCPSAVEGAKTAVEEADGKVVVTITGEGEDAVADIRKRAEHLASVSDKESSEVKHTGQGTGGGGLGKCPVVLQDATAEAEEVEGGAKVTLTPKNKDAFDYVLSTAQERAEAMESGHGSGSGTGGGTGGGDGSGGGGDGSGGGAGKAKKESAKKGGGGAKKGGGGAKKGGGGAKKGGGGEKGGDDEGGW